jgi:hypothetical protein
MAAFAAVFLFLFCGLCFGKHSARIPYSVQPVRVNTTGDYCPRKSFAGAGSETLQNHAFSSGISIFGRSKV